MSSHPDNKNLGPDPNRTFPMAVYKTVVMGGGAWFVIFFITLFLIAFFDDQNYSVWTHWAKFWGPAAKWWFLCFFLQSKVKDGGKLWWIATAYLVAISLPFGVYLLTGSPMGPAGKFLFQQVPVDLFGSLGLGVAEYLFPNVLPVPPPL